jgi:hypothetical protein
LVKVPTDDVEYVEMEFSPDCVLPSRHVLDVLCLPVLRAGDGITGLVLRAVEESTQQYERLGRFETSHGELGKLPGAAEKVEFTLV